MNFRLKLCHFIGAIKHSWIGLITADVLSVVSVVLFVCFPDNNKVVSFLIGIIASIIASIVYNISSKYSRSCSIYMWVLDQTEVLITYIETIQESFVDYRFKIWSIIVTIREYSRELTYTHEFKSLSVEFSAIIKAAYANDEKSFCEALSKLKGAQERITTKKSCDISCEASCDT